MLTATAVLFYVSYWLISKTESGRWQNYLRSKVERSMSGASVFSLWFASFLAVYREGAETILFYQALYSGARGDVWPITAGFLFAAVALAGVFALIKYGSLRVPLAPFFAVTSALLYYLAFTFAGRGIAELQAAGWLTQTPIDWLPSVDWIGLYPTLEGLSLQAALFAALVAAVVYTFVISPSRQRAMGPGEGRP
jgi:high-affinity iron transporter